MQGNFSIGHVSGMEGEEESKDENIKDRVVE